MSDAENLALVSAAYAAFRAGDVAGMFKDFAPDCISKDAVSLPYGGTYRGPDEALAKVAKMLEFWKDIDVRMDALTAGDGHVIAYGTFTATGARTGLRVSFSLLEVWKVENGKVVFVEPVYTDTYLANKAMGYEPDPADYESLLVKTA